MSLYGYVTQTKDLGLQRSEGEYSGFDGALEQTGAQFKKAVEDGAAKMKAVITMLNESPADVSIMANYQEVSQQYFSTINTKSSAVKAISDAYNAVLRNAG